VIARAGERIAIVGADVPFHARLRASLGLAPARAAQAPTSPEPPSRLGYCGTEYRVYPSMRIDEAIRFYSAMHRRWDAEQLAADLELAGLRGTFEVRRMKRAFQRALVLAFAAASLPELLVVESVEEFDEPGAAALLVRAIARAPAVLVTYGGEARPAPDANLTNVVPATDFEVRSFS
jgi:hypothetical protein